MELSLSEIISNEFGEYQKVILNYLTQPCKTTAIQNPVIKEPSLIINHQLSKKCPDQPLCFSFHNYEEKRRRVIQENSQFLGYNPIPCPAFITKFLCEDVDSCIFSHSNNEIVYHPTLYKTRECQQKPCPFEKTPLLCPDLHPKEPSRETIAPSYEKYWAKLKSGPPATKRKPLMNLNFFKTNPCTKKGTHDKKTCPYYHNDIDKRRSTLEHDYCFEICSSVNKNYCPCDQNCPFAKNKVEQLYHPEKYKRKFCENFPLSIQKCEYGDFCSFAHNESEIRTELFYKEKQDDNFYMYKYKTIYCPFKNEHDRSTCPYAHNVQDFRRSLLLYKYEPEECPNWSKSESMTSYEQPGCVKMLDCDKCHGWKEYEYHPMVYKTRLCSNGAKCQKKDCAYHHNKDKRSVTKALGSPNSEKQVPMKGNNAMQLGTSQTNLFKKEFSNEARDKKNASNFMRPLIANFIPNGIKPQEPQQQQFVSESTESFSAASNKAAQSLPNSITSTNHNSLLQESYSTRHNSANSSVKDSSEDEAMQDQNRKTPNTKKGRGYSPQSASSEKTFQKSKGRKPLKISKQNQSFIPSCSKEGLDEPVFLFQSKQDMNFPGLTLDFQPRSNTPDSFQGSKFSMNTEMLQHIGYTPHPRFASYGNNTYNSLSTGLQASLSLNVDEGKRRSYDPFTSTSTYSYFDIEEPKPVTIGSRYSSKPNSHPEENEHLAGKFMDEFQNDEDDLKVLLNQIHHYAEANNDSFNSDNQA